MPLALLWFGLGVKSVIFVVVHSVLWPMALNTYTGFVAVPQTLRRVGQNFGLTGWRLVAGILLPAAFPYLLSGIKIGWAFAWRTIIAAEMVFGVAGEPGRARLVHLSEPLRDEHRPRASPGSSP